jgi:hypothetical protein
MIFSLYIANASSMGIWAFILESTVVATSYSSGSKTCVRFGGWVVGTGNRWVQNSEKNGRTTWGNAPPFLGWDNCHMGINTCFGNFYVRDIYSAALFNSTNTADFWMSQGGPAKSGFFSLLLRTSNTRQRCVAGPSRFKCRAISCRSDLTLYMINTEVTPLRMPSCNHPNEK